MLEYRQKRAVAPLPEHVERIVDWMVHFEAPVRPLSCIVAGCADFDCKQTPEGLMCLEHWLAAPACSQCGGPGSPIRIRKKGVVTKVVLCRSCYCGEYSQRYLDAEVEFITQPKSPSIF